MDDIAVLFESLIKQYHSLERAEEAFRILLGDDEFLRSEYSEWCLSMGCSEKNGFKEFYQDYRDSEGSIWDSIYPNKEEYNDEIGKGF